MLVRFCAGLFAALLVVAATPTYPAEKTFQDEALNDAARTLEAELKEEAGADRKPLAALKKDADALLKDNDLVGAADVYVQIVASAPNDAQNWRRYAHILLSIPTSDDDDGSARFERATTASYIAYRQATTPKDEADALVTLAAAYQKRGDWRPALNALKLAVSLNGTPELQTIYAQLREKYGFRVSNFSVDSDAASPRACFQFTEALPKRFDFSPYVAVAGEDKPALSAEDQQICIEGLKHGESYAITLRAGLPSTVGEDLLKSADFNIYVRDRKPFVRLAGKAYVLPKTGQQGIPLVSVNTDTVKVTIYRIGDRNLVDTVLGYDFQRNLYSYDLQQITDQKGEKLWTGVLKVEKALNQDITTSFPVDEVLPSLEPGVYVLAAAPANQSGNEDYSARATQWFIVSDLGLAAFSGTDGIHVFANSLATTAPLSGVEVKLLARNNEILGVTSTDTDGSASFAAGLARGEGGLSPALLIASGGTGDYSFLSLKQPAFDLTDRGIAGRDAPRGLDAFVFTERGVYRTGETVYVTALLRDAEGVAATGVPLTLVVERPDGLEYRRSVVPDQGLGGRSLDVPIAGSAQTGTWRVRAFADPKGAVIGETSFLVEDYVPDRLEFDLTTAATSLAPGTPAEVSVDGRFLYGAPASGLELEGTLNIAEADERAGYPGYVFGLGDGEDEDSFAAESFPLEGLPQTDAAGKAAFTVTLDKVPASTHPLEATVVVRMAEPGGRAIERQLELPITPPASMIGVKPLFSGSALGDQDTASFDVVMVAPDGTPLAQTGLRWQLLNIESKYQWYRSDGYWQYEPIKVTRRVADGSIDVAPDRPGRISVPVSWGRYRLEVSTDDPQGPVTTFGFDSGWYAVASADTPDLLEIALDKPEYKPGDTITVAVTARSAGQVTLAVIGDRLITTTSADVEPGMSKLPLHVGEDWGTGAYVVATLRRPLDEAAKRMPGRSIGVKWFDIDKSAHTLGVAMNLPDLVRPETTLTVPVKLEGLAPNEDARIVVSAVDVGILNLTNYKAPAPEDYYLGQRKLSAEIRDLYGQLIDGMQGTKGQIRTGGDSGAGELRGNPPTQEPFALYSGIVSVGDDGTAEVNFDIPGFVGTARVMAVAWSKDKVGHAAADVTVRDPVVVIATLPRFLLSGDKSTLRLDLDNVEGESGVYTIAVSSDGPFSLAQTEKTVTLDAKKRGAVSLPVAATGVGTGTVTVNVTGPGDFALERHYDLTVKPATQVLARRTVKPLDPGQSITISTDVFADLVPGTGQLALSVSPSASLDVATLLAALDRYPLGCTEQIVSRALPLLYVNELSTGAHLAIDTNVNERITGAIETVLARQGPEGSFGLWSAGGSDAWLDAYTTDFLTRARAGGYAVPDEAFRLALLRLRNYVSTAPDVATDGGLALAYALYVLARNGAAPVGDLRYIADTKIDALATATARAQIGAALAMLGDTVRAERVFRSALRALPKQPTFKIGRTDYGSPLRDAAAVVTLAAEGGAPSPILIGATSRIDPARNLVRRTSTQDDAWLVLAARALGKQNVSLEVEETTQVGPYYATYSQDDLESEDVTVTNTGDAPVQVVVSISGAPVTPEPAADHGFAIERSFHSLDGATVDPTKAKQNQRFVVVLKVTEPAPQFARVALIDYLPAGFEIDNPRLVSSGDTGTLSWIANAGTPVHTEFRDDRFTAAFDRRKDDPRVFTVAYIVRAVSPGAYVLPQANVEDMYRPDRFGRTGTGVVNVQAAR